MLGSGIAMWQICYTTSCRIVVSLSVSGVVQHFRSRRPRSGVWHLGRVLTARVNASNIEHVLINDALTCVNAHGLTNHSAAVTTQQYAPARHY